MTKVEIARRQLGAALEMFLRGQDPVSVHCLAMAGCEIAEWLTENVGAKAFKTHILTNVPEYEYQGNPTTSAAVLERVQARD